MASESDERVICRTPTPNKKPVSIPAWKFEAVRAAILAIVPQGETGVPFKDLPGLVSQRLLSRVEEELGSVTWHTTTVKLEMEVRGELLRIAGTTPQRLRRP